MCPSCNTFGNKNTSAGNKKMVKTITGEQVNKRIADARKILEPEPVDCGARVPGWLCKRLRAYIKKNGLCRHYDGYSNLQEVTSHVESQLGFSCHRWFDHTGVIKTSNGQRRFVAEPYDFCLPMARLLDAIATALDIECHISPNSYHY